MLSYTSNRKQINLFTQCLVKKGKKHTAEIVIKNVAKILRRDYKKSLVDVFVKAVENVKPTIGFRNARLRNSSYRIPFFYQEEQQVKTAICWLLLTAQQSKKKFAESLAKELYQSSLKQGDLMKKGQETYALANQNKVFAHYRWF